MNRGGVSGPLETHRTHAMMGPISHSHLRRSVLLKWLPRDPSRAHKEERGRRLELHRAHHASLQAILVDISHAHRPRLPFRCPIPCFRSMYQYSPSNPPKNWPNNVQYLTIPCFHPSISDNALSFLRGGSSRRTPPPPAPHSLGVIRPIMDRSHPAHGQHGLFAARKIPPRTLIVEYIGEVHSDERPTSDYDISLYRFAENGESIGVDASSMGNEARFVNDYRGIRPKPNAEFADRRTTGGDLRIGIWSLSEGMRKGDEIVVSYGKGWWTARSLS